MKITVNPADNTLRFSFVERAGTSRERTFPATIDIGEEGRLLGIEIDITSNGCAGLCWPSEASEILSIDASSKTSYLAIETASEPDALTRSVPGTVRVVTNRNDLVEEVILPRRGTGYEITYPSGNR